MFPLHIFIRPSWLFPKRPRTLPEACILIELWSSHFQWYDLVCTSQPHNSWSVFLYTSLQSRLLLIGCTFQQTNTINAKKLFYLSLVRSKLSHCSQVWKFYLLKDISQTERVQRWATKFISNDHSLGYKSIVSQARCD